MRNQYLKISFGLFVLFCCLPLRGQSTAEVRGGVLDLNHHPVVSVFIIITAHDTSLMRVSTTDDTGSFAFPSLPVGSYDLEVKADGYPDFSAKNVRASIGRVVRFDIILGENASARAGRSSGDSLVETENAQLGVVMGEGEVTRLPLKSRDTFELLQLQPGVQSTLGADLFFGGDRPGVVSVSGGRARSNNYNVNSGASGDQMVKFYLLAGFALFTPISAAAQNSNVSPIPSVVSVTPLGTVQQNSVIYGRDGTFSALIGGRSVWTFGDTPISVPGVLGNSWDDNSLSWTTNLDASQGIDLNHDLLDPTSAPAEYLSYLSWERKYNYEHDKNHGTVTPCGAEFAMWDGPVINDPARNRVLFYYYELYGGAPGIQGWETVGGGIAVYTPETGITRPIENPGSKIPTLLWGPKDLEYNSGALVVDDTLFSYSA